MFEVDESTSLSSEQKQRLRARFGSRVTAVAQDSRSQSRNRELAIARLQERIATALRPRKRRRPTKPSGGARERRIAAKRRRSDLKRSRRPPGADD